ncbi:hypothetical protein I4U23_027631 [Adineta vaga]|nr:hypothetical protein I4U23_027631 [Adineta vaga]
MRLVSLPIDDTFLLNKLVLLGWFSLIFRPRHQITRYLVSFPLIVFTIRCLITFIHLFIQEKSKEGSLKFSNLINIYYDAFYIVASLSHFRVTELWLGLWMVKDFNRRYTCAYNVKLNNDGSISTYNYWSEENIVFTIILILTYFLSPIGLIVYFLLTKTYFYRFSSRQTIYWKNPQNLKIKKTVSSIDYEFYSIRNIRFGDSFPSHLRKCYRFIRGIIGILCSLIIFLFYLFYIIYCSIFHRQKSSNDFDKTLRWPPSSVRSHTVKSCWKSLITPEEKRNWLWKLKSYWLQICTLILFGPNGEKPLNLFRAMQNDFSLNLNKNDTNGFFPFGDGIGVSKHKYVKEYLESRHPLIIKDFQTVGWSVSSSLIKFSQFIHIFYPNQNEPIADRHLLSRKIVHQWLASFPHQLSNETLTETYQHLCHIVPRQPNNEPNKDSIYLAVGETIFYLATGGSLTRDERDAYLDCVKNPSTFLPDWFNFFIAGNYLENKGYESLNKFQGAFARHIHGPAIQAAFQVAEGHMSKSEVVRLITSAFCMGAAPGPAKLTANIIHRLWSDQSMEIYSEKEKMIDLFHENPRNFILESARMNSVLPMVSLISNSKINNDIKTHTGYDIPLNTRIHCSLPDANHDPEEFILPNEFNPKRSSLEFDKIMTWNGSIGGINQENEDLRPPRYCPGHHLSLKVMEFLAFRFAPIVTWRKENLLSKNEISSFDNDNDESEIVISIRELNTRYHLDDKTNNYYLSSLDGYTRLIMFLSKLALQGWNKKPPRAIDIGEPSNLPTQDLHIKRVDGARYVASWDEDDHNDWHFHTKFVNKILNSRSWPLEDHELQFNSIDDMIAWRWKHFPTMPPANNPFWFGDSDELMSHFAFYGLACHHTRKLNLNEENMELHCATLTHPILKIASYVNDMTDLSLFSVRQPFDRYGAAAYFDNQRRLIGIYLSHRNQLIIPIKDSRSIDKDWIYAKYMWRSSALAMVTIRDHLLTTHFIEANTLTHISREFLPTTHPLRTFLKPFTYRTVTINYSAATSLINQGGLCHRIWAFEHDEFLKLCDYVIAHYRFRIMPNWIHRSMKLENQKLCSTPCQEDKKCPKCGYNSNDSNHEENSKELTKEQLEWIKYYPISDDLPSYWKIVRNYVRRFFEIEYGKEDLENDDEMTTKRIFMNEPYEQRFIAELCKPLGLNGIPNRARLIDVLTQLICSCTGIHEHVGHVGDYLYDPNFIGTKIRRDLSSLLPSVQNYSLMLVLTVLTAMKMPGLMEDWSHLIPRIDSDNQINKFSLIKSEQEVQSHLDNYYLFKYQLNQRSIQIDQRHQTSNTFPFQSFNPRFMECSVSV